MAALPDGRAYEQATPVDKNGRDAIGTVRQVKVPSEGGAIASAAQWGSRARWAPRKSGAIEELVPYAPNASYAFLGSAGEGSEVVFESHASLGSPAGVEGASSVYAWERENGEVSLVSVDNEEQSLPKGAFGGSYD
ncbi:MAG: hypothetical protein QOF13_1511 [Solirubrobacterales bacterium]|nr:hypothetical protein [Solirubrobacterales bacterium]